MRMYATGRIVTYDADAHPSFHSNDSRFYYFVTRDGVRYMSSGGEMRWHELFSINRPVMVARGDIVAVGEISGGNAVYVFDSTGLLYRTPFENPVLTFSVNESGFLSAIVQYEVGYGIYIYNQHRTSGQPLFYKAIREDLILPTIVEVSGDGRYMAIAFIDLSTRRTRLTTTVQLRYLNLRDAHGTDGGDGLFSEDEFAGYVVSALRFMEDDRLIVATTSENSAQIICLSIQLGTGQSVVREMWNINLKNQLTHLEFYRNRYIAYVTGDRFIGADGADPPGTLRIVNINGSGSQTGYFNLNRRATHLRMGHNAVIVGSDRSFHAISLRGTHLWEHITLHDTRDVLFLDNTDIILVAARTHRAEVFRRGRVRTEEDDEF